MDSSETINNNSLSPQGGETLASTWKMELQAVVCEHCDWSYLAPKDNPPQRCPNCFQAALKFLDTQLDQLPNLRPPELLLTYTLSPAALDQAVQGFAKGIPFAPKDLNPTSLRKRLTRLYLPMWLVDTEVKATWKAEAGFDYQIVSHRDQYHENQGGWSSQEVKEWRVRWEPRLGKLDRTYNNVEAPALEDHEGMISIVGEYDRSKAQAYQPEALEKAFVRLPDRASEDAWTDAKPVFQASAAEECRQAAAANHIRQFSWQPEFSNQNWTLLMLPMYSTFYLDDEKKPQIVYLNGQSGQISGSRRASMQRAMRTSGTVLLVAILLFALSLLVSTASLFLPLLLAFGVIGLVIALLAGAGSILPITTVWWFNRGKP